MIRSNVFVLIFFIASQSVVSQKLELPNKNLFYYQPAASVFGAEAVWTNPASLAIYQASDIQIIADVYKWKIAKNWATVFTRAGFGVAYRKLQSENDSEFREYVFAHGMNVGGNLNIGISYRYIKEAPSSIRKKHLWNIGFIGKSGSLYRWGVVISNINRTTFENSRRETEMRYSLAYKPNSNKLTFAFDLLLTTRTKLRNADYIYHLRYKPISGLSLNALVDRHKNFEIGLRVNFFQSFIGVRRASEKNGHHRGSTFFYGSTTGKQDSIVKEKMKY